MKKKRIAAGFLAGVLAIGGHQVWAATTHYNDSSIVGGSQQWQEWVSKWEQVANDYTNVSLTPGSVASQLNFAWYSQGDKGIPVVYFGTDVNDLEPYHGTSGSVDPSMTGGNIYSYNYVTVDGLKENTTYYYSVEKNGARTPAEIYKTGSFDNVEDSLCR